jgi:Asp-tRNA(Asn)/Glu-tRNA(Gln) amidotransferase A subunit family amidase
MRSLANGERTPLDVAQESVSKANSNVSRNTYIHYDPSELTQQANELHSSILADRRNNSLFGIPISLKDCFDLAGRLTTCGSRFYAEKNPVAMEDSAVAQALKTARALITGKSHLHPLAYGITGQNPEYGDCLQPRDSTLLTGGSSSGAVASVQEGSALAAIGTDTGGSIRVPAALGGLVGFRASHSLASASGWFPHAWKGGAHLAPSFDTLGFLLRDPRDVAPIASSLFGIPKGSLPAHPRFGYVPGSFLFDSEPDILTCFEQWKQYFSSRADLAPIDTSAWQDVLPIFAGIQAHEASILHHGNYDHFEASIRDRLLWGASITPRELEALKQQQQDFNAVLLESFRSFDLLMLPAAPVARLLANADLSDARRTILRYTTPFSLAGLPALSLSGELIDAPFGTGIQIAAAPGDDPTLLALATSIGNSLAA